MKGSEVCIKTRSPPASLPIQRQVTKHTTVKRPILYENEVKLEKHVNKPLNVFLRNVLVATVSPLHAGQTHGIL